MTDSCGWAAAALAVAGGCADGAVPAQKTPAASQAQVRRPPTCATRQSQHKAAGDGLSVPDPPIVGNLSL